jgi:hypothetical protein
MAVKLTIESYDLTVLLRFFVVFHPQTCAAGRERGYFVKKGKQLLGVVDRAFTLY